MVTFTVVTDQTDQTAKEPTVPKLYILYCHIQYCVCMLVSKAEMFGPTQL